MVSGRLDDILAQAADVAKVARQEATAADKEARWPEYTIQALQANGLAGLVVPTEHGGLGQGLYALARVCETLGYECASSGLCFGMHSVGTAVIASKATPDHVERYLRPIAEGTHITTLALSEPGTGVHFYMPETAITEDGDGYVLNGKKSFITNGGHADSYVLSAQAAGPGVEPGLFSCVMVPNEGEGLTWGDPWDGLGMRGNSSRNLTLQDLKVQRRDRLGSEGDQIWYVFNIVAPYFLIAMAGTYLGVAQRALDETIEHLGKRRYDHSGELLAQVPVLQHRIASLWARVERTRRLIYWASEEADAGGPKALPALMTAKAEVADCAVDTVNDCMTLTGGIDYREGSILERLLRDARAAHVMAPTTDVLLTWAGRAILDQPLLGE